jgi:hypothetical protein
MGHDLKHHVPFFLELQGVIYHPEEYLVKPHYSTIMLNTQNYNVLA